MNDEDADGQTLCPSWAAGVGYLGVASAVVLSNWGSAVSVVSINIIVVVDCTHTLPLGPRKISGFVCPVEDPRLRAAFVCALGSILLTFFLCFVVDCFYLSSQYNVVGHMEIRN